MGHLVLNLFFLGAIAFVPNDMANPSDMTVYLLKGQHQGCLHQSVLVFPMPLSATGNDCGGGSFGGADCNPFLGDKTCCQDVWIPMRNPVIHLCACGLKDVDLILEPSPEGRVKKLHKAGRSLPEGNGDQGDIGWLLRMSSFNPQASRIRTWNSIKNSTPRPITARMVFGWEEAQSCHIDQNYPYFLDKKAQSKAVEFDINNFDFVRLEDRQGTSDHKQALAEAVKFSLFLPVQPVRIVLRDIDGKATPITLRLNCPAGICPDVIVGNLLSDWNCDDEEIGYHFADYYQLSRNQMAEELVPHRRRDLVAVPEEFSCAPRLSYPVEKIRAALILELRNLFQACPSHLDEKQREFLQNWVQTFGRGSVDLFRETRTDEAKRCLRRAGKKDLVGFVRDLITGISTRVICPMAMFDP